LSDVTIEVDGKSCTLNGYAPARLYNFIEYDKTLVRTCAALNRGIAGFEVQLPTEEMDYFCERVRTVCRRLSPAELSGNDTQQILALVSAVEARPALHDDQ
jgi:hypothetical protein